MQGRHYLAIFSKSDWAMDPCFLEPLHSCFSIYVTINTHKMMVAELRLFFH